MSSLERSLAALSAKGHLEQPAAITLNPEENSRLLGLLESAQKAKAALEQTPVNNSEERRRLYAAVLNFLTEYQQEISAITRRQARERGEKVPEALAEIAEDARQKNLKPLLIKDLPNLGQPSALPSLLQKTCLANSPPNISKAGIFLSFSISSAACGSRANRSLVAPNLANSPSRSFSTAKSLKKP